MNSAVQQAIRNIEAALEPHSHFPNQVLRGVWGHFRFFDADRIFEGEFVEAVELLLAGEGAESACLLRLEAGSDSANDPVVIEKDTRAEHYFLCLRSGGIETSWIYVMDDFACSSELGGWIIYAERRNEIAVIAFRDPKLPAEFAAAANHLHAFPIREAIHDRISYGYSDQALSPKWREILLNEYEEGNPISRTR